ncbi:MAG: VanZ family protein [Anaerolineae bacterium]|nr:VanZ family protein [Anaerolineae bacterium]
MARKWLNHVGLRWMAVAAWMAVIFALSAQPHLPDLAPGLPGVEEIGGHLVAYGILAVLLWWALRGTRSTTPATWALVITMLYGVSDELHQYFVPGRTTTVDDLLVDLIGASLGLLLVSWVRMRRLRAGLTGYAGH